MSTKYQDISYNLIKGLYSVLSGFVYRYVDIITLTLTNGIATVTNNGLSKTLTYTTSKTISATNFVTSFAADYLATGVVLTSSGETLVFTSSVAFIGNTTISQTFSDYFLPSKDESYAMENQLYNHNIGGFVSGFPYWGSSEYSAQSAYYMGDSMYVKQTMGHVRACRAFTSTTNYNLNDIGPAGGWIFWKSGNNYLETAPADIVGTFAWSNIINSAIGTTGTAIGTGQANTTAIINQVGHTDSAAKFCNDLVVTLGVTLGMVASANITYPIYKSMPKTPAPVYVWIGGVINDVEGTKDDFSYNGTVQVQVVDDTQQRADTKLSMSILDVIRGILKPTRASVFSISPSTLVVFNPGTCNEVIQESEQGVKVKLIDIYNFVIT